MLLRKVASNGRAFLVNPSLHVRMIGWPRLGADVLDGIDAGNGPLAVFPIGQVAADPRMLRELRLRAAARHQHQLVFFCKCTDDIGAQFAAGAGDQYFHVAVSVRSTIMEIVSWVQGGNQGFVIVGVQFNFGVRVGRHQACPYRGHGGRLGGTTWVGDRRRRQYAGGVAPTWHGVGGRCGGNPPHKGGPKARPHNCNGQ